MEDQRYLLPVDMHTVIKLKTPRKNCKYEISPLDTCQCFPDKI